MSKYLTRDQIKELLPPNISEIKKKKLENLEIDLENQDYLIEKIMARTNFSKEKTQILVREIFKELRLSLLEGKIILIPSFGKLLRTNSKIIFLPSLFLKKVLNYKNKFVAFKPELEDYGEELSFMKGPSE